MRQCCGGPFHRRLVHNSAIDGSLGQAQSLGDLRRDSNGDRTTTQGSRMKPMDANPVMRRLALKGVFAGALMATAGCGTLFRRKDLQPVCPNDPMVSHPAGPLTIDAHCHVFNGTDLQVKAFLSRVAVKQDGALGFASNALGSLLENLAWEYAPTGDEELVKLGEVATALQTCTTAGYARSVEGLKQDGYTRGRKQLQDAVGKTPEFRSLRDKRSLGALSVVPDSADAARLEALTIIEALPETADDYRATTAAKALRAQSFSSLSVQGLIEFVLQNFQYRYVSIHDYLRTYNQPGKRVVDLMLPSMVDYDFWLREGDATPTSLQTQVQVMRQIAILTGGRAHSLVPFDPLRQVAHELGHSPKDSLALVQEAVMEHGCIGVKLYPPMGFSALGNAERDGKQFWKQDWLPDWTDSADLGSRLDGAMRQFFAWCQAEQVPVMAHTSESNGPSVEFEKLTDSRYWGLALNEFPRLRISFGHFGGSTPVAKGMARAQAFSGLMDAGPAASGSMAFADAGYFVEVISKEPELQTLIQQLYEETSAKGDAALVNRFLYGTDWEMTLVEGSVKGFLGGFEQLFAELELQPLMKSQGHTDLAARFFGLNAARWAGLHNGDATRARLDHFYRTHGINKPDWASKLDKRSGAGA